MVGHPLGQEMGRFLSRDADIHFNQCMEQSIRFVRLYAEHPGADASTTSSVVVLLQMSASTTTGPTATTATAMTNFPPQRIGFE